MTGFYFLSLQLCTFVTHCRGLDGLDCTTVCGTVMLACYIVGEENILHKVF